MEGSASWGCLALAQKPLNGYSSDHDKWLEPHRLGFSNDLAGFHLRAGITSLWFTSASLCSAQNEHSMNSRSGQPQS